MSTPGAGTDALRALLREQKRECAALHAHPVLRGYRRQQQRDDAARRERGGREALPLPGDDAPPPAMDDLDAGEKSGTGERGLLLGGRWRL